jgi:hypothetical protein
MASRVSRVVRAKPHLRKIALLNILFAPFVGAFCTPAACTGFGKIEIQGAGEINGENVFVLRFILGHNPDRMRRPFFAAFDPAAIWLDPLLPAFGEPNWFWQDEHAELCRNAVT